jgi:sn1-specific diacylglycerol lipase
VVGHSLGAATAVLLALLLRPKYIRTLCYAFGPPGSVLDETTAKECAGYVISVVSGYDMICRLNLHSVVRLRESVSMISLLLVRLFHLTIARRCWTA